ncbi:class I SAM-dependent methyltransferase [Methylovirgula sp. 4M-Z18]|uniref:class I SAM-dependent methyltransferase n=1 Tax=Methylovirgula sp. 4M-Z18 TaxID=2293567 RepID=UPI000E2F5A97|nr:methyltransferase domain-containing protein [Methylovirgula sp. 4M-Z18]RFB81081.1 methyltransferase domain-containing protein [Methylovirgula sp. 4M-Z18]
MQLGLKAKDVRAESLRVLVAIASYGTSNDRFLERIIREYRSMSFDIDIVVLSNIYKSAPGVECLVGLPAKNPWSLPFGHKKLFVDRRDDYDLFIYSEDDILIAEPSLRAWLEVTTSLEEDEIAGFLRVEFGGDGARSYPDVHGHFHWTPLSVRRRGDYTLAHFTNEHAACYVLSRTQLKKVLESGGFDVAPHEGRYDLLCTAATDPYTQCGLTKLIPVSHLDLFTVHHMSNRYVGKMGVTAEEFSHQTNALLHIAGNGSQAKPLLPTETRLWRGAYSKDYYEPVDEQVTARIPKTARNILSIGCAAGATERWIAKDRGLHVVAIPLDPIIAGGAEADGVEMIYDEIACVVSRCNERFDCVLCLNVLHLAPRPQQLLSLSHALMDPNATLIVQTPNMMSLRALWRRFRNGSRLPLLNDYKSTGMHFSSARTIRNWCAEVGFRVDKAFGIATDPKEGRDLMTSGIGGYLPASLSLPLAASIIVEATRVEQGACHAA